MGGHGHGDHGHHHHDPYTVPKASTYKIENAPEVLEVQQALAKRGLKDPWARYDGYLMMFRKRSKKYIFHSRNEVWRYDVKQFGTHRARLTRFMLRGLPLGAALAAATIAAEFALGINQGGHGHDAHGDAHH